MPTSYFRKRGSFADATSQKNEGKNRTNTIKEAIVTLITLLGKIDDDYRND